ncbi:tRNA (guanine(9)-N(1))-methyltransferase [Plasmodiophora brassicae]|uniref:tRNA (guanine(9)-N(1))-methyltransferase n=1 Tax=Plasmodiophora brassicae TaxID=37360 RepID=A0A0G4J0R8_PLABS|nr:hypothetical protein PBRA_008452 [Plasmodiophora brassicae]
MVAAVLGNGDVERLLDGLVSRIERTVARDAERDAVASELSLEGLTKTARKKAIRRELMRIRCERTRKQERVTRQKRSRERARAVNQQRREMISQGLLTEEEAHAQAMNGDTGHVSKKVKEERNSRVRSAFEEGAGQKVVIDCSFDDLMTEKELCSFRHQLRCTYGSNKRMDRPSAIFLTDLSEATRSALGESSASWIMEMSDKSYLSMFPKDQLVYLTADADDVVDDLDVSKAYIIGGIVDHNRLKGLCRQKALDEGIAMQQLPIGKFLEGSGRRVLTVNQVADILACYSSCKDWQAAFEKVIPSRKGFVPKDTHGAVPYVVLCGRPHNLP